MEIRFRGFRRKYQEWVHGYLVLREEPYLHDIIQPIGDTSSITAAVERNSVGQYTGLKDKNGTEIYEGDVVEVYQSDLEGESVHGTQVMKNPFDYDLEEANHLNYAHELEVIGNIYEHPELLK